jgi:cytochrome c oxidase cbb3-type subunit 1
MGAAASFMLVVPLVIFGMNFFGTLSGRWSALKDSITLRFVAFGIVAFSLVLLGWVITSLHGVAAITKFTYVTPAQVQLGLYGFFSMVVFGALYYIVPRVLATAWASAPLANVHFWFSTLGVILLVVALLVGGLTQGKLLADGPVAFNQVTNATLPYLFTAVVALVILAIGQLAFALNFFWTLSRASAPAVRSVKGLLATQPEAAR